MGDDEARKRRARPDARIYTLNASATAVVVRIYYLKGINASWGKTSLPLVVASFAKRSSTRENT